MISLDTALALSIAVSPGAALLPGVNPLDAGSWAVWRFWGRNQDVRMQGALRELRGVTVFQQKNLNI